MKPVIIIAIAFVLFIPITVFAQDFGGQTSEGLDDIKENTGENLIYPTWILAISSIGTAIVMGIYFGIHLWLQKREIKRQALLERFNMFNDNESKRGREKIVHAKFDSDGKFIETEDDDYKIFKRELGVLDTTANMVKRGDIPKERFLELLSHVIIVTYESAKPYIDGVRTKRGDYWASDFIWLYREAANWWKQKRPRDPWPTKDDDFFVKRD